MAGDRTLDVSVVIGLVDKMSSGLKQIDNSINATKKSLESIAIAGVGIYTVTNYLKNAIVAAAQEEASLFGLKAAVEQSGKAWNLAEADISQYIKTTQKNSRFSDDQIIPGLQKLITFTKDTAKAMKLMTLATDLAAYSHRDLDTAVQAITQAQQGNIRMLSILVPGLRGVGAGVLDASQGFSMANYAMQQVQKTAGGFAAKELALLDVMMTKASDGTDDLSKAMGKQLEPATRLIVMAFTELIDFFRRFVEQTDVVEYGLYLLGGAFTALGIAMAISNPQLTALSLAIAGLAAAWNYFNTEASKTPTFSNAQRLIDIQKEIDAITANQASYVSFGSLTDPNSPAVMTEKAQKRMTELAAEQAKLRTADISTETTDSYDFWNKYYKAMETLTTLYYGNWKEYVKTKLGEIGTISTESTKLTADVSKALMYGVTKDADEQAESSKRMLEDMAEHAGRSTKTLIDQMEDDWSKHFEAFEQENTGALNYWLQENYKTIVKVQLAFATLFDYMGNAYKLDSINLANWKEDQIAASDAAYLAEYNRITTEVTDEKEKATQIAEQDTKKHVREMQIDQEAKRMQKEAYEKQKQWSIASAYINGAIAVTKTFADYGWTVIGGLMAAASWANTLMQVNIISAQRYATGVMGSMGGLALVGEQGRELVQLPQGSNVYNASDTRNMLAGAGGGGINVVVDLRGSYLLNNASAQGLADMVGDVILRRVKKERLV